MPRSASSTPHLSQTCALALALSLAIKSICKPIKAGGDYVHSIVGTGNPLDKTGGRPSFIKAFCTPKAKADVYTLFDRFARGGELSQTEQHYVMAVLVRGGVFGESGKE